jgi:HK97 family phage major capsid protein
MSALLETAKAEKRALSGKEVSKFNELEREIKEINENLKREETKSMMENKTVNREIEERDYKAFENYIRSERAGELVAGTTGAVIPTTIANKIMTKVYDICPILEKSTRRNAKGKLELPYYDESKGAITVAYATEFTALSSKAGSFDKIELEGFLAGALTLISNSLINNSEFNIVEFVIDEMSKAIAIFIEKELLKGTSGKVAGLSGVTKTVTTASATSITSDEVITLKDSIKDAYQNNAIFIMSNATRTALRLLKDESKRYLLQDDITAPFGTTLLGKPVFVSDNMDDIAGGKTTIYYGDMSCLTTKFSEDVNIQVLREKYADAHATGVVGWFEFDAKVSDANGIAKLVQKSAS